MTILNAAPEIPRDRWGRPLVIPPGGGKPVAYTRVTTYIDVLEDKYNLQKWMQRMVAIGLASRPDLLLAVQAHRDSKPELDRLCEQAREAAEASAAATTGTALHALTEQVDRGGELPVVPPGAKASLEAYREATADLRVRHIERFLVQDRLQVGGTADRIVDYGGESYIADIKTGSIEYGALKIAMQLALYAHSAMYDPASGARTYHGASTTRGIIIHLPAVAEPDEAACHLHWVDLEAGWAAVQVAAQVREQRKRTFAQLTEPFGKPQRPSLARQKRAEQAAADAAEVERERLLRMIAASDDPDAIRALWAAHQDVWTDALTEAARSRIASLPTVV